MAVESRQGFVANNGIGLRLEILDSRRLRQSTNVPAKLDCFKTAFRLAKYLLIPILNESAPGSYPPLGEMDEANSISNLQHGLPSDALLPERLHPLIDRHVQHLRQPLKVLGGVHQALD